MISGLNARPAQSSCLTSTFLNAGGVGTPQHQLSVAQAKALFDFKAVAKQTS
jgi:hypothetical protein